MFKCSAMCTNVASACSAAAASFCANLSVILDAAMLASILFILSVLGLHILCALIALISILRIMGYSSKKPECKT